MVKAHSLLYAIYICLIVAILCGALLYLSGLYDRLNLFYNNHDHLYVHNQSLVNYVTAKGNEATGSLTEEGTTGIGGVYSIKSYGLLSLIRASSFIGNDTITSAHFAGSPYRDNVAMYVTNFGRPLCYSGSVTIKGNKYLPKPYLNGVHIDNKLNNLVTDKNVLASAENLPEPNKNVVEVGNLMDVNEVMLEDIEKHDSLYYNSFLKPTKKIEIKNHILSNLNIKGNLILYSQDSLYISASCHLEDVIVMAPKVIFENNFKGTIQAFATKKILVGNEVKLKYPSVLMINNPAGSESEIIVKENSSIYGAIVLYGNSAQNITTNTILIEKKARIEADIYCTGNLICNSNINGFVYTNLFSYKTKSSTYENCIADVEINPLRRSEHFTQIPILEAKKYETLKKLF